MRFKTLYYKRPPYKAKCCPRYEEVCHVVGRAADLSSELQFEYPFQLLELAC
jgi:hypothetical protein